MVVSVIKNKISYIVEVVEMHPNIKKTNTKQKYKENTHELSIVILDATLSVRVILCYKHCHRIHDKITIPRQYIHFVYFYLSKDQLFDEGWLVYGV